MKRKLKVRKQYRGDKPFPQIMLFGAWLSECGFQYDDALDITVEDEVIIIKKDLTENREAGRK